MVILRRRVRMLSWRGEGRFRRKGKRTNGSTVSTLTRRLTCSTTCVTRLSRVHGAIPDATSFTQSHTGRNEAGKLGTLRRRSYLDEMLRWTFTSVELRSLPARHYG